MSLDLQNIYIVTLGNGHLMSSTPARRNLDSSNTVIEDTQNFNNTEHNFVKSTRSNS